MISIRTKHIISGTSQEYINFFRFYEAIWLLHSALGIFKEIFLDCSFFLSFIVFVLQLYNFTGNSPLVSAPIIPATQTQDPMKPPLVEAVPMASCPMYSMKSGMH